jgi:hypothetical protein
MSKNYIPKDLPNCFCEYEEQFCVISKPIKNKARGHKFTKRFVVPKA